MEVEISLLDGLFSERHLSKRRHHYLASFSDENVNVLEASYKSCTQYSRHWDCELSTGFKSILTYPQCDWNGTKVGLRFLIKKTHQLSLNNSLEIKNQL